MEQESGRKMVLLETGAISTQPVPMALYQNHPNPFNPSTEIRFYLPAEGEVTLDVYDVSGGMVARLIDRRTMTRGLHSVDWNGLDSRGKAVSSGVYFYRLESGKTEISRKMVLLR
jgi:flagellar hook assembly protein FlgD